MFRACLLPALLLFVSSMASSADAPAFPSTPEGIRPILLGTAMPDVALSTPAGKATTLAKAVDGKPAILVFYRGGWCPYCNLQLSELRLIEDEAETLGYQMIAISPDSPASLSETLGKTPLDYTLLSDSSAAALHAFGIGFRVDDATIEKYKGYDIDLEAASGASHHALPVPSVFIVDGDGKLQFSYVHPDYRLRVPGSVILAAARAIAERKQYLTPPRG